LIDVGYDKFERKRDDPERIRYLVTRSSGHVFLVPFDVSETEYNESRKLENQYENVPIQFRNRKIVFRSTLRLWDGNFMEELESSR